MREREGERESGAREGRKYAHHMNFQNFFTTKPLTRNHPFVAQKCSKTHLQQSKNQTIFRGCYSRTPASGEGEKEEWERE